MSTYTDDELEVLAELDEEREDAERRALGMVDEEPWEPCGCIPMRRGGVS